MRTAIDITVWVVLFLTMIPLHEYGHFKMAKHFGLDPKYGFRFKPTPAAFVSVMIPDEMSQKRKAFIALAGPAANIEYGSVLCLIGMTDLGIISIIIGLVSLIPIKPQDGWQLYQILVKGK